MKLSYLKLILFLGLALNLVFFSLEHVAYLLLFITEGMICIFLYKKKSSLYVFLLIDIINTIILNFILPQLIENTYLEFSVRSNIYAFSLSFYDFSMIYTILAVHTVAFSFLTFGKAPKYSTFFKLLGTIFILQQLLVKWISIEQFMIFFALVGLVNYGFYQQYKKRNNVGLDLKKEILFFLYFIGFTLSLLEHLSIPDFDLYSSTSYNYVIFLIITYFVLNSTEERLKVIIYNKGFKILLIGLILLALFLDQFSNYYVSQSAFLILILTLLIKTMTLNFTKE